MPLKFYIVTIMAALVVALTVIVAPYLRIRRHNKNKAQLESWYATGPQMSGAVTSTDPEMKCDFCGSTSSKKLYKGSIERADLLRKFNHRSAEECRFYEHRCSKCNSLLFKQKEVA